MCNLVGLGWFTTLLPMKYGHRGVLEEVIIVRPYIDQCVSRLVDVKNLSHHCKSMNHFFLIAHWFWADSEKVTKGA